MSDVIVSLEPDERKKLEEEVEAELTLFGEFFSGPIPDGCGNGPLVREELALLRTYLVAKQLRLFPSVLEGSQTSKV